MGSSDEDESVGKEIEAESFENQRRFINNEQNLMLSLIHISEPTRPY